MENINSNNLNQAETWKNKKIWSTNTLKCHSKVNDNYSAIDRINII